jgi:hypothetical protein
MNSHDVDDEDDDMLRIPSLGREIEPSQLNAMINGSIAMRRQLLKTVTHLQHSLRSCCIIEHHDDINK